MYLPTGERDDELLSATEHGRICGLAARGQRDLRRAADAYPDLFPGNPFDPTVFSTVALATAFGAPWCTREQLRVDNRAALWVFAVDWQIDYLATSRDEVDAVVTRCMSIVDGATPEASDSLGRFLAEIRDELAATPAFPAHRRAWRTELRRMLTAMAREWQWKSARAADPGHASVPTFDEYLDNADNFGSSFVNVSHWIVGGDPASLGHLAELTDAGRAVQRVLRLVNDLATYQRDVGWGDLNALMVAVDRAQVSERIAVLVQRCREILRPLELTCPQESVYLARQIGFSSGFYQLTDFWGSM